MTPPLDAIAVAAPGPTVPASRMQSLLMAHSVLAGPEVRLVGPTGGGEEVLTHICAGTGAFHASIWVVGLPGEAPRLQVGHGSLGARRVPTRGLVWHAPKHGRLSAPNRCRAGLDARGHRTVGF